MKLGANKTDSDVVLGIQYHNQVLMRSTLPKFHQLDGGEFRWMDSRGITFREIFSTPAGFVTEKIELPGDGKKKTGMAAQLLRNLR